MYRKTITIIVLITGLVFTAGLLIGSGSYVFAGENHNSSRSNTSTGIINRDVGNVLLRYGIGGAEINKVTDALAVGISTVDLKAMLVKFGVSDAGITELFAELDRLGTGDTPQSAIGADPGAGQIEKGAVSAPAAGDIPQSKPYIKIQGIPGESRAGFKEVSGIESETEIIEVTDGDDMTIRKGHYRRVLLQQGAVFQDVSKNIIQNIRSAAPEERENLMGEFRKNRKMFQTEIMSMNLSIRENAKELRDNFRKSISITINKKDKSGVARIAVAHGKGLRMLNRFRSAMARFDHILGRLESRIEKIKIEVEAEARAKGIVKDVNPPQVRSVLLLIEEAKNMQVENEAKLEELKAKYESLLLGENAGGIAEEARAIAKELKTEIENLHAKLRDIATAIRKGVGEIEIEIRSEDAT